MVVGYSCLYAHKHSDNTHTPTNIQAKFVPKMLFVDGSLPLSAFLLLLFLCLVSYYVSSVSKCCMSLLDPAIHWTKNEDIRQIAPSYHE